MNNSDSWGDLGLSVPDNPCYRDPAPVAGTRQADGSIYCHGCFKVIADNSGKALKPSCPHCWAAVEVVAGAAPECLVTEAPPMFKAGGQALADRQPETRPASHGWR